MSANGERTLLFSVRLHNSFYSPELRVNIVFLFGHHHMWLVKDRVLLIVILAKRIFFKQTNLCAICHLITFIKY